MLKRKLSDSYIAGLKPAAPGKRYDVYDDQEFEAAGARHRYGQQEPATVRAASLAARILSAGSSASTQPVSIEQVRVTARTVEGAAADRPQTRARSRRRQRLAALRAQQHTFAQVAEDYIALHPRRGPAQGARTVEREIELDAGRGLGRAPNRCAHAARRARHHRAGGQARRQVSRPHPIRLRPHAVPVGHRHRRLWAPQHYRRHHLQPK